LEKSLNGITIFLKLVLNFLRRTAKMAKKIYFDIVDLRCPKCKVAMNTVAGIWCGWVYRCPTCGYERWPKPKKKIPRRE